MNLLHEKNLMSDCAFFLNSPACISIPTLNKIAMGLKLPESVKKDPVEIFNTTKNIVNCISESCVLSNRNIVEIIGERTAKFEKDTFLKPSGPRDTKDWFSNVEIDKVMKQWNTAKPYFYNYPYGVRDYDEIDHPLVNTPPYDLYHMEISDEIGGDMDIVGGVVTNTESKTRSQVNMIKGYRCFGCVVNTDYSSGPGKHWMALFGDMRDDHKDPERNKVWTVEYFNSSGKIHEPFVKYIEFAANSMRKIVNEHKLDVTVEPVVVCDIAHQKSKSECGPYSMFYIYSRLFEDVDYNMFKQKSISDDQMYKFRKVLFRTNK